MSEPGIMDASSMDAADPLREFQSSFDLPGGIIYLDGNSLGPPPRAALERLQQTAAEDWKNGLIKSWNDAHWIDLPKSCGAKIAPLIGAASDEVIVCDSVSVNIFKLASALLDQRAGAIAVENDEFPTDAYILQGLSRQTGAPLVRLAAGGPPQSLPDNARVLIKSAVHYKTAAIADITAWEKQAEKSDAAIIWDLSHGAGLLDLNLKAAGAHYAVGCGYKYLNGGPGAPAFVYVDGETGGDLRQPLSGWMGHAAPFDFEDDFKPAAGAARFACGTPPILSLCALDAALDLYASIDMGAVEEKARRLGDLFLAGVAPLGLKNVSPGADEPRGGHVSLAFDHGYEVIQALIARGVIGDFRTPNLMRFGFSPLFLSYRDVARAAEILADIFKTEEWRKPEFAVRRPVT